MNRFALLPHEERRNVAGAIYGLILGSSIIAAAGAVAIGVALTELMVGVVLACRSAGATRLQATGSISAGALFALAIVLLKVFVHG